MKIMQMYKTIFNINHESIIGGLSFKKSYKLQQLKLYGDSLTKRHLALSFF